MKKIIPNIAVDNCKEVLEYYKKVFGGEVKMFKWQTEKRCSWDMRVKLSMQKAAI